MDGLTENHSPNVGHALYRYECVCVCTGRGMCERQLWNSEGSTVCLWHTDSQWLKYKYFFLYFTALLKYLHIYIYKYIYVYLLVLLPVCQSVVPTGQQTKLTELCWRSCSPAPFLFLDSRFSFWMRSNGTLRHAVVSILSTSPCTDVSGTRRSKSLSD